MRASWTICLVVLCLAATALAGDQLAAFVAGPVLEVADARLAGNSIVLQLPNGGTLKVPAASIDRVVAAEEAGGASGEAPEESPPSCNSSWADQPLPVELPFRAEIAAAARSAGLHPWLLAALVQVESAFDPRARSRAGAAGLTQLMPSAAADHRVADVWDPAENLRGGAAHLRSLLKRFGSLSLALAAYNAGAATVDRAGGVPPYRETRKFVRSVLNLFCPAIAVDGAGPRSGATLAERGGEKP